MFTVDHLLASYIFYTVFFFLLFSFNDQCSHWDTVTFPPFTNIFTPSPKTTLPPFLMMVYLSSETTVGCTTGAVEMGFSAGGTQLIYMVALFPITIFPKLEL